ncbi:hypothetical protein LSUE1_G009114 [Lachnellula suecica]|uniref:Prion-inhibition and propagation HeLo domain-containing protein n=1 Tax=Lachnellula suecica TaxID=602035 RepID=A0A8T9BZK2_9HELO|nr:hypothetical protein LSUE1_G009114 [Lachnellula suecica]
MDPISAAGIALSVASLASQVLAGCVRGIQLIITAKDLPAECMYLNLRLRMEEQRLFAWSETSGLLDYDEDSTRVLGSNIFGLHRLTVLELLVQIRVLFEEFETQQRKYKGLDTHDSLSEQTDDSNVDDALVPLTTKRKSFIDKAMKMLHATKQGMGEAPKRLRWAAFDKNNFEILLQRFSSLNDGISSLLDSGLQREIYNTTQDTNRSLLQLRHDIHDIAQLVKATMVLNIQHQPSFNPTNSRFYESNERYVAGLHLLTQLAQFKAFNEAVETTDPIDEATSKLLALGEIKRDRLKVKMNKNRVKFLEPVSSPDGGPVRSEALYTRDDGSQLPVWVEWKEYDWQPPGKPCPAPYITDRVQKLAALLHHQPKPDFFRVPQCLGYFDNATHEIDESTGTYIDDEADYRIGFVFQKPDDTYSECRPVSLLELLRNGKKPSVTDRILLAQAVANCILYLHAVDWLHKGLRSHNIIFFEPIEEGTVGTTVDYKKPYLSGFEFARPARREEQTEIPGDNAEHNMYRHPKAHSQGAGPHEKFRKSFDIYGMGVVLVELGHWMTVDQVLGLDLKTVKGKGKIAAIVKSALLGEERMNDLGANMGSVYQMVVKECLTSGGKLGVEENDNGSEDGNVSINFYNEVVEKLLSIRV